MFFSVEDRNLKKKNPSEQIFFPIQFKSESASERACRLSAGEVLRNFKDDIPWMFSAALWAHACHGKLSHLVVSFIFFISRTNRVVFFPKC